MNIHRVNKDESIYDIAEHYGISPMKLAEINEVEMSVQLPEGRELLVLTPTRTYNVKKGDSLSGIAARFGTNVRTLMAINPELRGKDKLYAGQLLSLRYDIPIYGMAATNGYFYRGCSVSRALRLMPYIDFLTVCSAKCDGKTISKLFDDGEILELARQHGKMPILRIYMSTMANDKQQLTDMLSAAVIMAKSRGYAGITLANTSGNKALLCENILYIKKKLMDDELLFFTEGVAGEDLDTTSYADGCVLLYDKIEMKSIPSFDDGERRAYTRYAEEADSSRTFIELPSFVYNEGRYLPKDETLKSIDRWNTRAEHDDIRKISRIKRSQKEGDFIYESLENTKAKLELLSELGYMGISFDIMRTPLCELIMFNSMFSLAPSILKV